MALYNVCVFTVFFFLNSQLHKTIYNICFILQVYRLQVQNFGWQQCKNYEKRNNNITAWWGAPGKNNPNFKWGGSVRDG